MKWQKSYLVGLELYFQENHDKKIDDYIKEIFGKNSFTDFILLFIALIQLLIVFVVASLALFIEYPIRCVVFKGSLTDKFSYWIACWKSVYSGLKGDL